MLDANISDIASERDKTVKKVTEKEKETSYPNKKKNHFF